MYGYTNEDGEPIMDGVAYRFEQELDDYYAHERYLDEYDRGYYGEPEPLDPATCSHGNGNFPQGGAGFECTDCDSLLLGPRTEPLEARFVWGSNEPWGDDFFVNYGE